MTNTGDFSDDLTPNSHIHRKYMEDRKNADLITAAVNIGAFLPVTISGTICDSTNLAHRGKFAGISEAAIANGFTGLVQYGGEMSNIAWTWTAGDRIYINGQTLSSTPPVEGTDIWLQCVGVAINANTILIKIEASILF